MPARLGCSVRSELCDIDGGAKMQQHDDSGGPRRGDRWTLVLIMLIGVLVSVGMLVAVFTMDKESDRPDPQSSAQTSVIVRTPSAEGHR